MNRTDSVQRHADFEQSGWAQACLHGSGPSARHLDAANASSSLLPASLRQWVAARFGKAERRITLIALVEGARSQIADRRHGLGQ